MSVSFVMAAKWDWVLELGLILVMWNTRKSSLRRLRSPKCFESYGREEMLRCINCARMDVTLCRACCHWDLGGEYCCVEYSQIISVSLLIQCLM